MKRCKFTEARSAFELKQTEAGTLVVEFCRKATIIEATFHKRRKNYNGFAPSEMNRLKIPDEENAN